MLRDMFRYTTPPPYTRIYFWEHVAQVPAFSGLSSQKSHSGRWRFPWRSRDSLCGSFDYSCYDAKKAKTSQSNHLDWGRIAKKTRTRSVYHNLIKELEDMEGFRQYVYNATTPQPVHTTWWKIPAISWVHKANHPETIQTHGDMFPKIEQVLYRDTCLPAAETCLPAPEQGKFRHTPGDMSPDTCIQIHIPAACLYPSQYCYKLY